MIGTRITRFFQIFLINWLSCVSILLFLGFDVAAVNAQPKMFNVCDFGAIGDGETSNTEYIQKAINVCEESGGGTVYFPAGIYKSGTIFLKSNVHIYLETNAVLLESKDMADHPLAFENSYAHQTSAKRVFVHGIRVRNVTIEGFGVIDGNMARAINNRPGPLPVLFENSSDIALKDVTVRNAPVWSVAFFGCNQVDIIRVKCLNSRADGINIICCQNVLYDGVFIENAGDDPITIKNGSKGYSYDTRPDCGFLTENVVITNCVVKNCPHPAIKFGTGSAGIFRNIMITNCIFENTGALFTIQLMRPNHEQTEERVIENVTMSNIIARNIKEVFDITSMGVNVPIIQNLRFNNITIDGFQSPSKIYGLEEAPIRNISISNIQLRRNKASLPYWLHTKHVHNLEIADCEFNFLENINSVLKFEECSGLDWNNVKVSGLDDKEAAIQLMQSKEIKIRNSISPNVTTFVYAKGNKCHNIRLLNSDVENTKHPLMASDNVPENAFFPFASGVDVLEFKTDKKITSGECLHPRFTLRNNGDQGMFKACVMVEGKLSGSRWYWLNEGDILSDSITTNPLYRPGKYVIHMGGIKQNIVVKKSPANIIYGDTLEVISPASAGALTWVNVPVKNIGGTRARHKVQMIGEGKVVNEIKVTLEPGETKWVKLEHRFDNEGSHEIKVGDLPVWNLSTYTTTDARFYRTRDRIIIDAGGRWGNIEDQAVAYFNDVVGDYVVTAKLLNQDQTTGSYAAIGLVARNEMTDDESGGLNRHYRVPKYGAYKIWYLDTDGDGNVDTRSDGGHAYPPVWFRLEKQAKTFRAYTSSDGVNWLENRNQFNLDTADTVQDVGIYGSAFNPGGKLCRVEFESLKIENK